MMSSVQDRTNEFRSILTQAHKRISATKGHQRQALLSDPQRSGQEAPVRRSQFARNAADIGRGIGQTTEKLQRLAQCMYIQHLLGFIAYPPLLPLMVFSMSS